MKFVEKPLRIVKDNLLEMPPLFNLIRKESGVDWKEMYEVFNMGHRLEIYTPDNDAAENMIQQAGHLGIEAKIIGRVEESKTKELMIKNPFGVFQYS